MKQTNKEKKKRGLELLEALKKERGGEVLEFHKRIANDPDLLTAFINQYKICNKDMTHLPRRYKELIIMAIGCVRNTPTAINVHSKLALEHGATLEEVGETLRIVFFLAGSTALLPGTEVFEPLEME